MSDVAQLQLTKLRVRRTIGITDAFVITGFCKCINLVHGPNASGKTSIARVIEAVIWPNSEVEQRLSVTAEYLIGDSRYHVDIDAGRVGIQRDGADAKVPDLPAPQFRHRYRLSLHRLLAADNADFAAEIVRQSVGGYDLAAAGERLNFRNKPSVPSAESKAVDGARSQLKEAQGAHAVLQGKAGAIGTLEAERDVARQATEHERILALALRRARAAAAAEEARQTLSSFPEVMAEVRSDDYETLLAIRTRIRDIEGRAAVTRAEFDAAKSAAANLLSNGPPTHDILPMLRHATSTLERLEQTVSECERRVADTGSQLVKGRLELGPAVADEQLTRVDAAALGELSDFAREAEKLRAEIAAIEAELRRAGDGVAPNDLETVRDGIRLLAQWSSATSSEGSGARRLGYLWVSVVLATIAWGVVAWRWHWAFLVLAAVAVMIGIVGARTQATSDSQSIRERDYARLDLPQPEEWARECVKGLLDTLQRRLVEGRLAEYRCEWHAESQRRHAELAKRMSKVDERRVLLAARFGVAPDTDERQLSWLIERIGRWQDAAREAAGAQAQMEQAHVQRTAAIASLTNHLAAFGYDQPACAAHVAGSVADLERRIREHAASTQRHVGATIRLEELECAQCGLVAQCTDIVTRAGVAEDDDAGLETLCTQHPAYVFARDACRDAERDRDSTHRELEAVPGFQKALVERSVEALEADQVRAAALAADLEVVTERLARLSSEIERAKRESNVEEKLAAVNTAEAKLIASREREVRAIVGGLLLRHVQEQTRDNHRPAVFHRARELFATITRGRYRLELNDETVATFRAVDVESGLGHSLNELSSGSRVQLLLAVRIAFVETQENSVRLPLLLDEVLATSDDRRAHAIIDAVITLALEGRQVFYFTAQGDEVGKWVAALEARHAEYALIDLAFARSRRDEPSFELPIVAVQHESLPAPNGSTHDQYGALLGVQPLWPEIDAVGATHLWYLVDDPLVLHKLLSLGLPTWGAFQNLVEHGGMSLVTEFSGAYSRAAALVRALEAWHDQMSIGHGRLVDRLTLLESEAVSERHIENVAALAAECGGWSNRLLDALEQGKVAGFQKRKVADLRDYLEREGYLDLRPSRGLDAIRASMLAAVADDIIRATIEAEDIDGLLLRIALRARPTPKPSILSAP